MAIMPVNSLVETLRELDIHIEVQSFIEKVNSQSSKHISVALFCASETPPGRAWWLSKNSSSVCISRLALIHLSIMFVSATAAFLSDPGPPLPPPAEPVVTTYIDVSTVPAATLERHRKLIADARAIYGDIPPTPYVISSMHVFELQVAAIYLLWYQHRLG